MTADEKNLPVYDRTTHRVYVPAEQWIKALEAHLSELRESLEAWTKIGKWAFRHHSYCDYNDIPNLEKTGSRRLCNCGLDAALEAAEKVLSAAPLAPPVDRYREALSVLQEALDNSYEEMESEDFGIAAAATSRVAEIKEKIKNLAHPSEGGKEEESRG